MLKRQSKHLALLLVLTMLATLFVGVGVAQASSVNTVSKVISVADDYDSDVDGFQEVWLQIKENKDNYAEWTKETFEIVLPDGVEWSTGGGYDPFDESDWDIGNDLTVTINPTGDDEHILSVTLEDADTTVANYVRIPLCFKVDGVSGDIKLTIDAIDSAITGGEYTFARVAEGSVTASVNKVEKIAKNSTSKGGTIELRETSIGALADGTKVTIKLPSNFKWGAEMKQGDITFRGGFLGCAAYDYTKEDRTLEFTFDPSDKNTSASGRGIISIPTLIKPDRSAAFGEVEVSIAVDSKDSFDTDLVIAEYVDWGVSAKVDSVKELLTGKFEQKTGKLIIEEKVPKTLLDGRDLTIELPDWVKITNYNIVNTSNITRPSIDLGKGDQNYIDIPIDGTSDTKCAKIELKLTLSMDGAKSGDVEANIFGAGVDETSIVLAKAIAPATASIEKVAEVKIGIQNQPIDDITFTEGKKESWKKDPVNGADEPVDECYYKGEDLINQAGKIMLSLTEGAKFAATPTVEVTDGNFEISKANVRVVTNDTQVEIPVKSESTKISTIKVSNIKLTLDRSIPEGDLKIKIGGPAIVENSRGAGAKSDTIEAGEFSTGNAVQLVAAKVITPADTNIHAVATYVIGNTIYQINGVDQAAMDQAPYIKNDRTFLPIRFVAYGLGIGDNGIIWDQVNQTVTLMKNDKVVQLKIGSTTMLVNGAAITMDAAPEITAANRTCLPIRFVAEAFGAVVGWDAATQTVTVTL